MKGYVLKFEYLIQINRKNIQLTQFHTFLFLSIYLSKIDELSRLLKFSNGFSILNSFL